MGIVDWFIIFIYMAGMIAMSVWLGRTQESEKDYYLGGNDINHFAIALSTMATQCSTNSLLGAPAFVIATGGLLWMQYELGVPLAMIAVMMFLLPFFRKLNLISVYEYLEKRFGVTTRTLLSVLFQFIRAFATGVTVYGISIVLETILGIPFWIAVLILGVVTVIYDFFGGMKAVIYSDVIQMIILYGGIAVCLYYAISACGGFAKMWELFPKEKAQAIDFKHHGFGDGKTFAFWPMLFGGFFLYVSYYGCDQSQVQRELSSRNVDDTNMSLFLNGILRFPLVLTYIFVGVALTAFIVKNPDFLKTLPYKPGSNEINYNLAVPIFCLKYLPHGVIGFIMAALFSAAMSSLDSTINSLSATTIRDIIERFYIKGELDSKAQLLWSRLTTIFWGAVCIIFSFFVGNISKTILEAINKIGSVAYGPILATFLLGILTRKANESGTIVGIIAGFAVNIYLWRYKPEISWMWWNAIGCIVTFGIGYLFSFLFTFAFKKESALTEEELDTLTFSKDTNKQFNYKVNWPIYYGILVGYFVLMVIILKAISK